MKIISFSIRYLVLSFFYFMAFFRKKKELTFMPHADMCINDNYSLLNYKSDNTLTFINYLLKNGFLKDKVFNIAVSQKNDVNLLKKYVSENYPGYDVHFYKVYDSLDLFSKDSVMDLLQFYNAISKSSHIFTSQTRRLLPLTRNKLVKKVNLGYYSASFKNDVMDRSNPYFINYKKVSSHDFDCYVCSSSFSIMSIYPTFSIPYNNYVNLGMCRNDYLFSSDESVQSIRKELEMMVPYSVKTIVLYTPTHKDYERNLGFSAARELLGFAVDFAILDSFLRSNGILIVCKLHPHQNKDVIKKALPESIKLFEANTFWGLSELMKVSDALMTDYTSGYYDYLILDKPVIFNFYDIDKYNDTRGFAIMPIETICAGEIIKTEEEMIKSLSNLDHNRVKYSEKRKLIKELVFSNCDSHSCERVYNYLFN